MKAKIILLKYYLILSSQNPIKFSRLIQSQSQNPYHVYKAHRTWLQFFSDFMSYYSLLHCATLRSSHTGLLLFLNTTDILPFTVPYFIRSIICHSPMKAGIFICFVYYFTLSSKKCAWNIVGIQYSFIARC